MSQSVRQSSFARGEIDPAFRGRSDIPGYAESLSRCRDFIVVPTGALVNRPGTQYIGPTKTQSDAGARLVPFLYTSAAGVNEPSILEFGDLYVRVWTLGSYVGEVVSPFAKADLVNLQWAQAGDVLTLCCRKSDGSGAYQPRELRRVSASSWVFSTINFTGQTNFCGTPTFDSAGAAYNAATTYKRGDYVTVAVVGPPTHTLKFISLCDNNIGNAPASSASQWAAAVDANHPAKNWQWKIVQVFRDKYGALRRTWGGSPATGASAGGEPVYADRPITLTWAGESVVTFSYSIIGYEVHKGLNGVFGYIGETDASTRTFTDDGIAPDFSRPPPAGTDPWKVANGFASFAVDYPEMVCFFEQRRMFARTKARPQLVCASKSGDIDSFDTSPVSAADDALEFTVAGLTRDEARALVPMRTLVLLCQSSEQDVSGRGAPLAPDNVQVRAGGHHGSTLIRPVVADGRVIHALERGAGVRDLIYDQNSEAFGSDNLSRFASHLFDGGVPIVEMAFQEHPYSVVWMALGDGDSDDAGKLLGMTYAPDLKAVAWHRHDIGGLVESLAVVPEGVDDVLYVLVKRTINGATARYLERFGSRRQSTSPTAAPVVFLDSWLTYTPTPAGNMTATGASYAAGDVVTLEATDPTMFGLISEGDQVWLFPGTADEVRITITSFTSTTEAEAMLEQALPAAYQGVSIGVADWNLARRSVTGLSHLEGEEVKVYALDGTVQGPFTVAGGAITLTEPLSTIYLGLPYEPLAELLPVASERSRVKGVKSVSLEVVASRGFWAGEDEDNLTEWRQRSVADSYGTVPASSRLLTQTVETIIRGTWNTGGSAVFVQRDPLPCTVVGVTREVEFAGKT